MNTRPIKERFLGKIVCDVITHCWMWTASRMPSGYGQLGKDGSMEGAHRVSWEIYHGKIPKGLYVLHKCDVKLCVNPDHLFVGTQADNIKDMCEKGRRADNQNKDITHCKHGHEFSEENTYRHRGKRACKKCKKNRYKRDYARSRKQENAQHQHGNKSNKTAKESLRR